MIERKPGFDCQFLKGPLTALINWAVGRDDLDKNKQWMFGSEVDKNRVR